MSTSANGRHLGKLPWTWNQTLDREEMTIMWGDYHSETIQGSDDNQYVTESLGKPWFGPN